MIRNTADSLGLCGDLAVAIAQTESSLCPHATRFEPGWKYFYKIEAFASYNHITPDTERVQQAHSWGLMQIMGSVARELKYSEPLVKLCDPYAGAEMGCKKLKQLSSKYEDETAVIAAYNAGTPRKLPGGKWENQDYVSKVTERLRKLRMIGV